MWSNNSRTVRVSGNQEDDWLVIFDVDSRRSYRIRQGSLEQLFRPL